MSTEEIAPPAPANPIGDAGDQITRYLRRAQAQGSFKLNVLAVVSALIVGGIIIGVTDLDRLGDGNIGGIFTNIGKAYWAIPKGAFGSWKGWSEIIVSSTPLLLAGLSVMIAFRTGLFNIGATGQMIMGGLAAVYVGFSMKGPGIVQIPLAVLAGATAGMLWGALVGFLKAKTGAHEVITTIMLNYIAAYFAGWLLKTDTFAKPGAKNGVSKQVANEAQLPRLLSFLNRARIELRAHMGVFIAVGALIFIWWFIERSKKGFEARTVGSNLDAARYAGMHPGNLTVLAMAIAGACAGLAGSQAVLGTNLNATPNLAGNIGFDAIAVALLGKNKPWGVAASAVLFGVLEVGGRQMQVDTDVPNDLIAIIRALIVLFIAAPLLTKWIWRIKGESGEQAQAFRGWGG